MTLAIPALAQSAATGRPTPRTNQVIVRPTLESPAESTRRLLVMNEADRQKFLAALSPTYRRSVEAKLKEYQALSPDERAFRLKLLDLRWHFTDLIRLPPANRPDRLALVLAADRPVLEARLTKWDELPPAEREELLTNQITISYFLRLASSTPAQRQEIMRSLTDAQRDAVAAKLVQLGRLSEDTRQNMVSRFQQFFDLDDKEKEKVLNTLPDSDRQQLRQTLKVFDKRPLDRRDAYLRNLEKFINFTPDERGRFLQNAARWQAMPSTERQAWRDLVKKIPDMPPLPPGMLPPLPPGLDPRLAPPPTNSPSPADK